MAIFQRTLAAAVAAAALAGSFALPASAQTPASTSQHPTAQHQRHHHGEHRAKPFDAAQHRAAQLDRMKNLLQLQPQQQAAWDKYVAATQPPARPAAKAARPDVRTLTTLERLDLQQKLRKERTAAAEQRDAATRSFYTSLNPSQQKAFDTLGEGHRRAGLGAKGHPRHGHGPHHAKHAKPVAPGVHHPAP